MDNAKIYAELTAIFHNVFDDGDLVLAPETNAKQVDGWDSLAHLRLILSVERVFGVKFSAAETGKLKNVGELAALIDRKLSIGAGKAAQ